MAGRLLIRTLPIVLLLLLVTALLVATATALPSRAEARNLTVKSVSAVRSATAGLTTPVEAAVRRSGRTPAAAVAFYLSADARHDAGDARLGGTGRVRRGGSRAVRGTPAARVPPARAIGEYGLIAGVDTPRRVRERNGRDTCRAAKASLKVTATPVGTRELVAADVAAGKITPQQGLVYRVLALFGDPRLPAKYAGDTAEPEDGVLREVVSKWPSLSRGQRAELQPFFTPPAAKRSWASRRASASSAAAPDPAAAPKPICASRQLEGKEWRSIAKEGGHVRVWWQESDEKKFGPRARHLVTEIENEMWPKLLAVMGREPISDGGQDCFHGIDGKLDLYLTNVSGARGLTVSYPPSCSGTASFIVFDNRGSIPLRWEIAHELMHAFQYAYSVKGPCETYNNWDEAVATWAADYVYPKDDWEHGFKTLLRDPDFTLEEVSYDGWVFPYAMEQLHGSSTIRAIYEASESHGVLEAIDAGVPGGLKQAWPEFARLGWNQDPGRRRSRSGTASTSCPTT